MAANNKCSDCGNDREEKYKNDNCCKACRASRNKAKRVAAMEAKGKQPYGSGRSPNCSKCGELKDAAFLTSGYCRKCKLESIATKRAKARIERGQLPFGEGRRPTCYQCGKVKENPFHGYCNVCHAEKDRQRRAVNIQSPEFVQNEREKVNTRCKEDPIFKLKKLIHHFTNSATRLGILERQPCEECGEMKVEAHHDDYNKPADVRWLCRKHHNRHHRKNGEAIQPYALLESLIERHLF